MTMYSDMTWLDWTCLDVTWLDWFGAKGPLSSATPKERALWSHRTRSWVGLGTGLDAVEERQISWLWRESNHDYASFRYAARRYTDRAIKCAAILVRWNVVDTTAMVCSKCWVHCRIGLPCDLAPVRHILEQTSSISAVIRWPVFCGKPIPVRALLILCMCISP
jgi:hypothetical protein